MTLTMTKKILEIEEDDRAFGLNHRPAHIDKVPDLLKPDWRLDQDGTYTRTPKVRFGSPDDWIMDIIMWFKEHPDFLLLAQGYEWHTRPNLITFILVKPTLAMGSPRHKTFEEIQRSLVREVHAFLLTGSPSKTIMTGVIL